MGEPFKNLLGPREVRAAALYLSRPTPRRHFDPARFEALALDGLERLELKARAEHIASALEATLPAEFARAAARIEAALAPPAPATADAPPALGDQGLAGWIVWPLGEYVARRGLSEPTRALRVLHALTQRFTAEWALRPFLEAHPEETFATLRVWAGDPSAQVRRLVSEGSRPRLPWGRRLAGLVADPTPTLPLLAALQDDPSAYVRRSVANHLNDIAQDHPEVVAGWLEAHLPDAPAARRALLRHASRSLIKRGDTRALRAFGLGAALRGAARLVIEPPKITLGASVTLHVTLASSARKAQDLVLDYVVHHVKANGGTSPKVFKGWTRTLGARESLSLSKRHAVRPISTRKYYPGRHRVALQANGKVVCEAEFELEMPDGRQAAGRA
ncbi:MAG: DNA alkylation repair protein [Planctomycetota bacterium]